MVSALGLDRPSDLGGVRCRRTRARRGHARHATRVGASALPVGRARYRGGRSTNRCRRARWPARCARRRATLAEAVTLFDLYRGEPVPAGHKSLAFHVVYRDPEATLTDKRVDEVHARVTQAAEKRFRARSASRRGPATTGLAGGGRAPGAAPIPRLGPPRMALGILNFAAQQAFSARRVRPSSRIQPAFRPGSLVFANPLWLHGSESNRRASMTKAEIIDCVYEKVGGFSKKESAEVVEAVFETMKETLARGDRVKISGFGNFVVREKKRAHRSQSADRRADSDQRSPCAHVQAEPSAEEHTESAQGRGQEEGRRVREERTGRAERGVNA